jgi:hypothetical protein
MLDDRVGDGPEAAGGIHRAGCMPVWRGEGGWGRAGGGGGSAQQRVNIYVYCGLD